MVKRKKFAVSGFPDITQPMTLLPIVERELRVAARKSSTFWLRIAAALIAVLVCGGFFALSQIRAFGMGGSIGRTMFAVVTWMSLAAALAAGLFFTADSLSEEKREGTLGFLFLTDLHGYDIVFGKLVVSVIRCLFPMLAIFPVLAVTLTMGGVTGAQFWRTMLALVNALMVSLSAGLFISAISRDSHKVINATLVLLICWVGGGPIFDSIRAATSRGGFTPTLSLASPGYLFSASTAWAQPPIGMALLINQIAVWTLLAVTSFLLPRLWQQRRGMSSGNSLPSEWQSSVRLIKASPARIALLSKDPICWLVSRGRWQNVPSWIVAFLLVVASGTMISINASSPFWIVWSSIGGLILWVLYLGVAAQSGRFFVEGRRIGLLELLLATPLPVREIVDGHKRALRRWFLIPVLLCVLAQTIGFFMMQRASLAFTPPPRPRTTVGTNTVVTNMTVVTTTTVAGRTTTISALAFGSTQSYLSVILSLGRGITTLTNLWAMIWFGMWVGLRSKNPSLAALKTIACVQIVPWFAISFLSNLAMGLWIWSSGFGAGYVFVSGIAATVLALGKDIGFVLWSRKRLYSKFREAVTEEAGAKVRRMAMPPVIEFPPVQPSTTN